MKYVYSYERAYEVLPKYLTHWDKYGFGWYSLFEKNSEEFIGRAGIFLGDKPPEIELGYTIAKTHWRKGYSTEACQAIIKHGFVCVGAQYIMATIIPENIPSAHVANPNFA